LKIERPKKWDNFIGQEQIKENLKIFISSSKKRKKSLDHILFFGPPGLGKTTLAHIVANELNSNIFTLNAPMIQNTIEIISVISKLEENDVLFIDEIHRLPMNIEEILYTAMEDNKIDIVFGQGFQKEAMTIELPPFTLIGATTLDGMISKPLKDRFGIDFQLQRYNENELIQVIENYIKSEGLNISKAASKKIASYSRGTPRIALQISKRIIDYSIFYNETKISINSTNIGLKKLGYFEYGLKSIDIKYLKILINSKKIGINNISKSLMESIINIENNIEPYLINLGFVIRENTGRIITQKGIDFITNLS